MNQGIIFTVGDWPIGWPAALESQRWTKIPEVSIAHATEPMSMASTAVTCMVEYIPAIASIPPKR